MIRKRLFLVVGLLLLQFLALPIQRVSSQSLASEDARIITLGVSGTERANALVFSLDGRHLVAGASAGIYLLDPQTLETEQFIPTGAWVRALALSPDGSILAAGLLDQTVRLYSFPAMQPVRQFDALGGWTRSLAFTPDGRLLAAAAGDAVRLWSMPDGIQQLIIPDLAGVRVLAVSPDSSTLAVGLQDNTIQLRSLADGSLIRTLRGHEGWVRSLAFSPDGALLASGAFDATARLWDVAAGELLHTLTDHQSSVLGIAFSPDGSTLATGSVDQTVRLWDSASGSLLRTFIGHSGFVYSVVFSPDGAILASGANDSTVRLWDPDSSDDKSLQPPKTPSDCRVCHHPANNSSPVAVVDVSCEACHANGLGVNWCPFFARSTADGTKMELVAASHEESGVPIPGRSLAVSIASPSNGEVVYANSEYVAPLQVTGRVVGPGLTLDQVDLRLEVWQDSRLISSLSGHPKPGGQFAFNLGVNPEGSRLRINDPAAPFNCAYCHDDYFVQAEIPSGRLRLSVIARAADGDQAVDERWLITDVNHTLPLDVRVTDASSGRPLLGLVVHATTRLYEWRGRTSMGTTGADGLAVLPLEALSQSPTNYQVEIPSQVVDGVYYSSSTIESLKIDPSAAELAPISLQMHSQKGEIVGNLSPAPSAPLTVWAVQLPAGPAFQAQVGTDGRFQFAGIPVAEYTLFVDPAMLGGQGLSGLQATLDLVDSPSGAVHLETSPAGAAFTGTLTGGDGEWLPFGWLLSTEGNVSTVDLRSGSWAVSSSAGEWTAIAPGYYSQELGPFADLTDLALKPRPDTRRVAWGPGYVVLPSETRASANASEIDFESGWIWGQNSGNAPLTLVTDEAAIELASGQFALERPAGGIAWLYIFSGEAKVSPTGDAESVSLSSGQMLALSRTGLYAPMAYDPAIAPSLRPLASQPPDPSQELGLLARLRELFMHIGVILAQLVTFITYFVAVISLVGIPWLAVRWLMRTHKASGEENERN